MLKRQRLASPPPSSSNVPLLTDSSNLETPNAKRRRTLPPILDGKLRGWATPSDSIDDGDDGYEDEDDSFSHNQEHSAAFHYNDSPYKTTNNLLHELHALNKHRLLFAVPHVPSQNQMNHTSVPGVPYYPDSSQSSPHIQQEHHITKGVSALPGTFESAEPPSQQTEIKEIQCVRTRYEDTNRILGSLFLSRRRELDGDDSRPMADT